MNHAHVSSILLGMRVEGRLVDGGADGSGLSKYIVLEIVVLLDPRNATCHHFPPQ